MPQVIDLRRFKIKTTKSEYFWKTFSRVNNLKIHDASGVFGIQRYDYFLYRNNEELRINSTSKVHVLIHTKKSIDNMEEGRKSQLKELMKNIIPEIDIDEVSKNNEIIYAVEDCGTVLVGQTSMSIFFRTVELDEQ